MHGKIERLLEVVADRLRLPDDRGVLGDAPDHLHNIDFLVAQLSQGQAGASHHGFAFHLAGNHDHAERIDMRAPDAGDGVGGSGAGGHIHGGETVGQPKIAFGRHGAGLLVMTADVLQAVAAPDGVIEVHRAAAGHEKDMVDAVAHQRLRNIIGQAHHLLEITGRPQAVEMELRESGHTLFFFSPIQVCAPFLLSSVANVASLRKNPFCLTRRRNVRNAFTSFPNSKHREGVIHLCV